MHPTVALRCDASPRRGVGHALRCLALADELRDRGARPFVAGAIEVDWVAAEYARRGVAVVPAPDAPEALASTLTGSGADAVVLDHYGLDTGTAGALRAAGLPTLSILDGSFGAGQDADLFLDQNLGAERRTDLPPERALLGLGNALFRDEVLARRGPRPLREPGAALRVLCVFGGTDALGAAGTVVPIVLSLAEPVHVIAVTSDAALRESLSDAVRPGGPTLELVGPTPDLPTLAASCDLVLTAAGSSVWEFLCIGVPMAVVCVVDNQEEGYEQIVSRGCAAPLGRLESLSAEAPAREAALRTVERLVASPSTRAALADRGRALVDGTGRVAVVDALLALVDRPSRPLTS
ncbi:MAG: hypothetical protein ABIS35_06525 [Terracoccus sp.]